MQRVAELYYATGNAQGQGDARQVGAVGDREHHDRHRRRPSRSRPTWRWSGAPATWNPTSPAANTNLHVTVTSQGQDVGVAAAVRPHADLLRGQVRQRGGEDHRQGPARRDLDANADAKGVSVAGDPRRLQALRRRLQRVAPARASTCRRAGPATMPNGDAIAPGKTLPRHPVLLPERPGLAEGAGVPERRRRRRRSTTTGSGRRPTSRWRTPTTAGCSRTADGLTVSGSAPRHRALWRAGRCWSDAAALAAPGRAAVGGPLGRARW